MAIGNLPVGNAKAISTTANVKASQGAMLGIFCSSSTSGTITLYDDAATGTSTAIAAVFNVTAGTWYSLPVAFGNGLYVVVGGTAAVTVVLV
jgi:hypothetical protein